MSLEFFFEFSNEIFCMLATHLFKIFKSSNLLFCKNLEFRHYAAVVEVVVVVVVAVVVVVVVGATVVEVVVAGGGPAVK